MAKSRKRKPRYVFLHEHPSTPAHFIDATDMELADRVRAHLPVLFAALKKARPTSEAQLAFHRSPRMIEIKRRNGKERARANKKKTMLRVASPRARAYFARLREEKGQRFECIETGEVVLSLRALAGLVNMSKFGVRYRLKHGRSVGGKHYRRIETAKTLPANEQTSRVLEEGPPQGADPTDRSTGQCQPLTCATKPTEPSIRFTRNSRRT